MWKNRVLVKSSNKYRNLYKVLLIVGLLKWSSVFKIFISILESLNTCISLIPFSRAIWQDFNNPSISAWLFVLWPRPQLKLYFLEPSWEYITLLYPTIQGFPLEAPSKNIEAFPYFFHQSWKFASVSRNLHLGVLGGRPMIFFYISKYISSHPFVFFGKERAFTLERMLG